MKCPNCNAETRESICPYCGAEMPKPTPKKNGCPKCGSTNIGYRRESQGRKSSSTSFAVTKRVRTRSGGSSTSYRTVGLCQNCGYAWVAGNSSSSKKPWWWWILMIYIWPFALSIWFWKTNKVNLSQKTKGIILGAVWGALLLIIVVAGLSSDGSKESTKEEAVASEFTNSENSVGSDIDTSTATASEVVTEELPSDTDVVNDVSDSVSDSDTSEEPAPSETIEETKAYATDRVKIRQQPNTDCDVLGMINPGDEVTVLGTEGDWSHVIAAGNDGYIKSEYLTSKSPSGVADDVSIPVDNNTGNSNASAGAMTGTTIVNATNGMIHDAGCSKLPNEDNRIYFNSVQDALNAGYSDRCGICHPQ